jgi:hypothetical protein
MTRMMRMEMRMMMKTMIIKMMGMALMKMKKKERKRTMKLQEWITKLQEGLYKTIILKWIWMLDMVHGGTNTSLGHGDRGIMDIFT